MKTKLKHIIFWATVSLAATACGGGMAKPPSGLDLSLLPAQLLSVGPSGTGGEETAPEPVQAAETKTTNQTTSVND